MTWMAAEAAVAITAGLLAAPIALVGFGLDSAATPVSISIHATENSSSRMAHRCRPRRSSASATRAVPISACRRRW
jgi:hypothetical protein